MRLRFHSVYISTAEQKMINEIRMTLGWMVGGATQCSVLQ